MIASCPALQLEFAGASSQTLHAVHYMFSHPSVEAATHYCNGNFDNTGYSGSVLGSLFMRHLHITIERTEQMVYMHEDSCGDDGWVGLSIASAARPRVDDVQIELYAPELAGAGSSARFPVVTNGVAEPNWAVVVVDADQETTVRLTNIQASTFELSVSSDSPVPFGRPLL